MTDKRPLVTIGIPTYGRAEKLDRTLSSVRNQNYQNLEIYVADDASPDQTSSVVAKAMRDDERIIYHRHEYNIGARANHEFVLERASGKYFMWLNDDDLIDTDFVARLVEILEQDEDIVLAFCDYRFIDESYRTIGSWQLSHLYPTNPWIDGQLDFWSYPYSRSTNLVHGIHRTHILRQVRRGFDNTRKRLLVGHEAPLLAQVAMYGRVVAIPECLFSRMSHYNDRASINNVESARMSKVDMIRLYVAIFRRLLWYAIRAKVPIRQRSRLVGATFGAVCRKATARVRVRKGPISKSVPDDLHLVNEGV